MGVKDYRVILAIWWYDLLSKEINYPAGSHIFWLINTELSVGHYK